MSQTGTRDEAAAGRRPISVEGYGRLLRELESLRGYERVTLSRRARQARLFVDEDRGETLAQVAEQDLAVVERKIADLEALLASVQAVEAPERPEAAAIGTAVTVRHQDGTVETLTLVGPAEADPARGRVSSESRGGRALLGARPGGTVTLGSGPDAATLTVTSVAKAPSLADEAITPTPLPLPTPPGTALPMAGEGR